VAETRCRFAPAPTGHLHIGGARTALFNWLFARGTGGKFILRIEDTDVERNDPAATEAILESLRWLGLDWDEGPFYQSERLEKYTACAAELRERDLAYEETDERGTALRFRMPQEDATYDDVVHGSITYPAGQLEDFVIVKSNGWPTYNFACAVDDHDLAITHIIRGDDHLANTPKQAALCRAFGWDCPAFAHVPMIHGEDGSKLSKRHGASSALEFREEGYLPEALVNFIALLGWSPGDDREVMSLEEMISSFSLERIRKTSAIFNREKLDWMNGEYVKSRPVGEVVDDLLDTLREGGYDTDGLDRAWVERLIELYRDRAKRLAEIPELAYYLFEDVRMEEDAVKSVLRKEGVADVLAGAADRLEDCGDWTEEEIERILRKMVEDKGVNLGKLGQPIRVAVTGGKVSPGIFETLALVGREKTLARLRAAADMLSGEAT
jgi:glutamyl-tRNA synthetase